MPKISSPFEGNTEESDIWKNPFSFATLSSVIQLLWQYPTDLLAGPVQTAARACQPTGI